MVIGLVEREQVGPAQTGQTLMGAGHILAQGMVGPEKLVNQNIGPIVGRVVDHIELFTDHVFFFFRLHLNHNPSLFYWLYDRPMQVLLFHYQL